MSLLNRRRFLTISAAAISLPLQAATLDQSAQWRGVALGASASLRLAGLTQNAAAPIFEMVEHELARLENIFSLYRAESEISRLNRDGVLPAPSHEFLEVLSLSGRLNAATGGAFDPTVQPLWSADAAIPPGKATIGWQHLRFDSREIAFVYRGDMGLTLNGVAQGYITDKIAALLIDQGLGNVLVDFGEIAARGQRQQGEDWRVGIAAPDGQIVKRLALSDRALATSAPMMPLGAGTQPSPHIFSPVLQMTLQHQLVSISATSAAVADGLSTACCLLSKPQIETALQQMPGAKAEVLHPMV